MNQVVELKEPMNGWHLGGSSERSVFLLRLFGCQLHGSVRGVRFCWGVAGQLQERWSGLRLEFFFRAFEREKTREKNQRRWVVFAGSFQREGERSVRKGRELFLGRVFLLIVRVIAIFLLWGVWFPSRSLAREGRDSHSETLFLLEIQVFATGGKIRGEEAS